MQRYQAIIRKYKLSRNRQRTHIWKMMCVPYLPRPTSNRYNQSNLCLKFTPRASTPFPKLRRALRVWPILKWLPLCKTQPPSLESLADQDQYEMLSTVLCHWYVNCPRQVEVLLTFDLWEDGYICWITNNVTLSLYYKYWVRSRSIISVGFKGFIARRAALIH